MSIVPNKENLGKLFSVLLRSCTQVLGDELDVSSSADAPQEDNDDDNKEEHDIIDNDELETKRAVTTVALQPAKMCQILQVSVVGEHQSTNVHDICATFAPLIDGAVAASPRIIEHKMNRIWHVQFQVSCMRDAKHIRDCLLVKKTMGNVPIRTVILS